MIAEWIVTALFTCLLRMKKVRLNRLFVFIFTALRYASMLARYVSVSVYLCIFVSHKSGVLLQ